MVNQIKRIKTKLTIFKQEKDLWKMILMWNQSKAKVRIMKRGPKRNREPQLTLKETARAVGKMVKIKYWMTEIPNPTMIRTVIDHFLVAKPLY